MANTPNSHVLILGAGGFGASTAYHLSLLPSCSRPKKITLIDRSPLGCGIGASEDINKIIRTDYTEKFYMDLGYEAIDAWKAMSEPGGVLEGLHHRTGWVCLYEDGDEFGERVGEMYKKRGG
jgi:sarcosine oxidase/L-pipecolate oxidase